MDNFNMRFSCILLFAVNVFHVVYGDPVDCKAVVQSTDIRTSPLSCDFNKDTCGYSLSGQWKQRMLYGYHLNHDIIGLDSSPFVVYDRSFNASSKPSVISTPELKPGNYCLAFWLDSTSIYERLHIRTSNGQNITGDIKGRINSGWIEHIIHVSESSKPFTIDFQYIEQPGILSVFTRYETMAIDDILLVRTSGIESNKTEITCAPGVGTTTNGTCDFNTDSCGYSIQGHFERRSGRYNYGGNYIQQGRETGSYIVCNWQATHRSNNNTVTSTLLEPGTYCLSFWYYMTGPNVGLSVFTSTGTTLFANIKDPEDTHTWTQVSVTVAEKQPFWILFQILRATGFFTSEETVGLDDIRVASIQQKNCTQIVPDGTCTFTNKDTCGYTFDSDRWKAISGQFELFTRPVVQTGQDDGFYALFESFQTLSNEIDGQPYDVISPELDPGYYCLSFWYFLPNHYSNVSLIISTENHNATLWSVQTSQKNWTENTQHLNQTEKFKVVFRCYHVTKYKGAFVALDNIRLTRQPAKPVPQKDLSTSPSGRIAPTREPVTSLLTSTSTNTTTPVQKTVNSSSMSTSSTIPMKSTTSYRSAISTSVPPSSTQTDTSTTNSAKSRVTPGGTDVCQIPPNKRVIVKGGCDFNIGDCGYNFPPFLWSRHNESTGMVIFGPTDNDIGLLQTFAVFQSNDPNVTVSTVADITSTTINSVEDICLKLWLLMPNQNSQLEIYVVTQSNNRSELIYDYRYTLASQWRKVEIPIHVYEPFKLVIRSQKENNYGYIGIDSIQLYQENVPPTTTASTRSTESTTTSPYSTTYSTSTSTTTTPTKDSTSTNATYTLIHVTSDSATPIDTSIVSPAGTFSTERTTMPSSTARSTPNCTCNCPTFESECTRTTSLPVTPIPRVCAIPETSRIRQPLLSCTFDKDTCGFYVPVYPHLWERSSYRLGNTQTGEINGDQSPDHSGGYMLFNTYNSHVQNSQTHSIQSAMMSTSVSYCLSFWYIMPTNHSNLAVYITYDDQSPWKLVWNTHNQIHSNWTQQLLGISENKPFYVRFQSTKESFFSFLGVDNIQISSDAQKYPTNPVYPITTPVSTSITTRGCNCSCPKIDCDMTTTPPIVVPPCGDLSLATRLRQLSCDFDERHACGYTVPIYPHLWELHRFEYGNTSVGYIRGDASTDEDGSYLLFNTNNYHVQSGQHDEVTSPIISTSNNTCLSFMYNMPTTQATLRIYQDIHGQRVMLWQSANTTTSGWKHESVVIPAGPQYQVVFSSVKTGRDSYLGIDNIGLFTGLRIRTSG